MSAEKILKRQTKEILAKENWAKSITGFLCVLSVFVLCFILVDIASVFIPEQPKDGRVVSLVVVFGISLLSLILMILLSPLYTGYIRFIANCKDNDTGDIQDLFYYFAKGKYINTVQINLLLLVRYSVYIILCALPSIIFLVCMELIPEYEVLFKIFAVWFIIGGVVGLFFISRLFIMTEYLYVSDFNYRKESEIIRASKYMVKRNYSKVISIHISYIPWLLLCFFVIPVVFVYPYFKHCTLLSYSYIYEMENNNPSSPYYKSNQPLENIINNDIPNVPLKQNYVADNKTAFNENLQQSNIEIKSDDN